MVSFFVLIYTIPKLMLYEKQATMLYCYNQSCRNDWSTETVQHIVFCNIVWLDWHKKFYWLSYKCHGSFLSFSVTALTVDVLHNIKMDDFFDVYLNIPDCSQLESLVSVKLDPCKHHAQEIYNRSPVLSNKNLNINLLLEH